MAPPIFNTSTATLDTCCALRAFRNVMTLMHQGFTTSVSEFYGDRDLREITVRLTGAGVTV